MEFAIAFDLVITNTFYIKEDEHLITFTSGANRSQIDYFLVRSTNCILCKDCKVIPKESATTQYRLLVLDVCIKGRHRIRKEPKNPRTRWWNLKDEKLNELKEKIALEARWELDGDIDVM